ncbi:YceI family protein [Elizabethkingia sp. JS20170427COW]|uniref:YceI family protein n=1 Tax=Elizabethkingia sp. JS20170427COW TaxID=2583851 RepID=UPI0011101050|nr:YceI family protein [Elizabethkingia sp. JS20170427COW]QCX54306.1 YceI family protein [Elizabethkingia sp. JS20170427COW]
MSTKWTIDPSHSEIQFKVKHMVISTITGAFEKFDSEISSESDDFSNAHFSFSAEIDSINTKNIDRDNHLKSADFFDAEHFPRLTFSSEKGIEAGKISGILEICGVQKEVTLDVDFGGVINDPFGMVRAGFEISGRINRKDFGLSWSQLTEAGGLIVGDDIKISANVEFVKQ